MLYSVPVYFLSFLLLLTSVNAYSQEDPSEPQKANPKQMVTDVINTYFPEFIDLGYADSKSGVRESWFVDYNYNTSKSLELSPTFNGSSYSFDSGGAAFFAKGSYTFSDDANPRDYSQVGGEYRKRWLGVGIESKVLNKEEQNILNDCLSKDPTFKKTVNICRAESNIEETLLSMFYFDLDAHVKVEGSKNFDERNYAYGAGIKFSAMPRKSSWVHAINIFEYPGRLLRKSGGSHNMFPIFSLGLEQVDPKEDARRNDLVANKEKYDRVYGEIRHTSSLGKIKGGSVKLSFNYRYFEELDPPDAIKNADLDVSQYYTIAFQIPSTVLPTVTTSESEFIISYSEGELPFGRTDERVFEIGWRTNVEFGKMFAP